MRALPARPEPADTLERSWPAQRQRHQRRYRITAQRRTFREGAENTDSTGRIMREPESGTPLRAYDTDSSIPDTNAAVVTPVLPAVLKGAVG